MSAANIVRILTFIVVKTILLRSLYPFLKDRHCCGMVEVEHNAAGHNLIHGNHIPVAIQP